MIPEKPLKALQQNTPEVQNKEPNLKEPMTYVVNSSSTVINHVNQSEDMLLGQDTGASAAVNIALAPADYVSVDMSKFYSFQPTDVAKDVAKIALPDGFLVTLNESLTSPGKYGTLTTANDGTQTVTVNAQIPDVDGIISYEVRLIKND